MRAHDRRIVTSSEKSTHRTPQPLRNALRREFPIVIDLAATRANTVCPLYLGPDHHTRRYRDALTVPWARTLRILYPTMALSQLAAFLNPPWSRTHKLPLLPWIKQCVRESRRGLTIVTVLPAAIQTAWWHTYVLPCAYEIRFIPHRVSYDDEHGVKQANANFNSAIVVWKPRVGFVRYRPAINWWTYRGTK